MVPRTWGCVKIPSMDSQPTLDVFFLIFTREFCFSVLFLGLDLGACAGPEKSCSNCGGLLLGLSALLSVFREWSCFGSSPLIYVKIMSVILNLSPHQTYGDFWPLLGGTWMMSWSRYVCKAETLEPFPSHAAHSPVLGPHLIASQSLWTRWGHSDHLV